MNIALDAIEARVIGSLMEKSLVTPDQYPLSLNALVAACNQKSSRDPVMALGEADVQRTVDALQKRYLVREQSGFGSRVPKYHYRLFNDEIGDFRFSRPEQAVMCLLLLRGPQTPGELRSRAGRLFEFADVTDVESTLEALTAYEQGPFVVRLPREPGRREARYAHLFGDEPVEVAAGPAPDMQPAAAGRPGAAGEQSGAGTEERLAWLERRVDALEAALAAFLDHPDRR